MDENEQALATPIDRPIESPPGVAYIGNPSCAESGRRVGDREVSPRGSQASYRSFIVVRVIVPDMVTEPSAVDHVLYGFFPAVGFRKADAPRNHRCLSAKILASLPYR